MLLKASCFNKYIETHEGLSALKYGGGIKYFYSIPTLISSDKIRFLFKQLQMKMACVGSTSREVVMWNCKVQNHQHSQIRAAASFLSIKLFSFEGKCP